MTSVPVMFTYTSVVIYETGCIVQMLVVLNLLDTMAADIMNAHITASCKKEILTTPGA